MSIITVSRGSFSNGRLLAECLARSLGYRSVDRDVIVERAAAQGVSQEDLRDALDKPPGLLDRGREQRYLYLVLIQAALVAEVRTGNVIYHGNAGHLLLKDVPGVLRVRIIAPLAFRVREAQERLKLTASQAQDYITRADHGRHKWVQYLYGVDWGDPALYDLVLNREFMDLDEACATVAALARQETFAFTPQCRAALDDLALASRLRVALALDRATSHLELEAQAHHGAVRIRGAISSLRELADVERISSAVPGVKSLDLDDLAAHVSA